MNRSRFFPQSPEGPHHQRVCSNVSTIRFCPSTQPILREPMESTLWLYNAGVEVHEFPKDEASEAQTGISPECQRGDYETCRA